MTPRISHIAFIFYIMHTGKSARHVSAYYNGRDSETVAYFSIRVCEVLMSQWSVRNGGFFFFRKSVIVNNSVRMRCAVLRYSVSF